MQIAICDDEPQILKQLVQLVSGCMQTATVTGLGSAEALLEQLEQASFDILLLDIDMPGMSGLEVAGRLAGLKDKPLLIFVTSHDELVYDSLQFHPFGFVRKEFWETELPQVLKDCESELGSKRVRYHFHTAEGEVSLPLEELLFLEAEANYIQVHTVDKVYRFRETMAAVQEALAQYGFVRVHRGFLVNQAVVELLGADEVKLTDGSSIPIGRSYAETAKREIMRYMLQ